MAEDTTRTASELPGPGMLGRVLDGTFQIIELLGMGGVGEVYRARDLRLQRDVAVKMLSEHDPSDEAYLARFEREARAASAVNHANIAHIYSVGQHAGRPYYVMELVEGASLADRLADTGALSPDEGRELLIQACQGLRAASEKGVVHRDLKPGNLMVDRSGTLKIVDFGLARRAEIDQTVTQKGHVVGTPAYMAPEQALGKPVDHRTDIYALGVTFFELLSGRRPFEADTPLEVVTKHLYEPPPPLRDCNPKVPPSDSMIIHKMLSKAPQTRYQSYDELLAALEMAKEAATTTSRPLPRVQQTGTARRVEARSRPSVAWVAIAVVVVLVAIVIGISRLGRAPGSVPAVGESEQPAATSATGGGEAGAAQRQPARSRPQPFDQPPEQAPASAGEPGMAEPLAGLGESTGARASTVEILSRISAAVEAFRARQGRLPTSLGEVRAVTGSSLPERDAWGTPVHYRVDGPDFFVASPGEDRVPRTADDLFMRNGHLEQPPAGGPRPRRRPSRR